MALKIESLISTLISDKVKRHLSLLAKHKDRLRVFIVALLIVYLAYVFSQLTLSVLSNNIQTQAVTATNITISKPELRDISAYRDLFGEFHDAKSRKNYKTVKATRLNLTLIGTIFKEKGALAIIKNGNSKSKVYQKGDKITSSVLLKDIAKNYVVIETGGRLEKILIKFPYIDSSKGRKNKILNLSSSQKNIEKLSRSQRKKLNSYFQNIATKPLNLLSLVSVKPHFLNGKFSGFRINPSKEKQLFHDLGFQKNDIVVRINDMMFDNLSNSLKVMQLLKTTKQFDIYLQRNGQQHVVAINLTK